jgi:SAM-dependent methyltransferase
MRIDRSALRQYARSTIQPNQEQAAMHSPSTLQLNPEHILKTGLAFWASKTLLSAVELGLFTELVAAPLSADEIGARLGLHERSRRDFLDALVSMGFLQRTEGRYANTAETALFLDRNKPSYLGGILEMCSVRLFGFWSNLTEGLRTGKPQNEARNGQPELFEILYAHPAQLEGFLGAMTGLSHPANVQIARLLPWAKWNSFVDVGAAQGDLAVQITSANPHVKGTGFDLAPVQAIFEKYVAKAGLADRLNFQHGDFFAQALPKADVVLMGHILHDWDLPTKRMLIGKAFDALPSGGALVVYDAIIDDDRRQNTFGLLMSLNMLIETQGGYDYSGDECAGWMRQAGFGSTSVTHLAGPDSMVVAIKD